MRVLFLLTALLCLRAREATAQEQEGKLMDRLLKPDMTLQNGAQTKHFDVSGAAITKVAPTKTFHYSTRSLTKSYGGVRNFSAREFHTTTSAYQRRKANVGVGRKLVEARPPYSTGSYSGVRPVNDAQKIAPTSEFAENRRAFLVRGKSQKMLSAKDQPLTLEQVRDLLNKNK